MSAATVRRLAPRSILALPLAGLLLAACAGQGDISRVQPDAIDKAIFVKTDGATPRLFYYRKTTVGVPPTSSYSFDGLMGDMYKVRFEIRQEHLIGYRSHDYAVGSQNPITGGDNNTDTPFLIYKIRRTSTSSANTTRRPARRPTSSRRTRPTGPGTRASSCASTGPRTSPRGPSRTRATRCSTSCSRTSWTRATRSARPTTRCSNPDRPIVRPDYIDWTSKEQRTPDILACYRMFGADDEAGPWGCGPAEITYRNSLLPVPESEYEPMAYPDREILNGRRGQAAAHGVRRGCDHPLHPAGAGGEQATGDDCTEASLDQFAKFGFFRTVIPGYDRQVGATVAGRQYFINRWNIWQETIDEGRRRQAAGGHAWGIRAACGIERTPRTITYYLNPEFPDDPELREMAHTTVQRLEPGDAGDGRRPDPHRGWASRRRFRSV